MPQASPARLLLDTHVLLWWLADPSRLRSPLRRRIANAEVVYVSAASVWEAQIKSDVGKLAMPERLSTLLEAEGFVELPVTMRHAEALRELPPIHKDPFDRLLIAQARCERLGLVSSDAQLQAYPVDIVC